MALQVPGVGLVPVLWMPASAPDFGQGRGGKQPIAIVHHRIVGTLQSADLTFARDDTDPGTEGSPTRQVAAHFGIGLEDGKPEIHQYVNLSDTAYCNGDYDPSGSWDEWYGQPGWVTIDNLAQRDLNARTISIEHHDNGGSADPAIKGIVPEAAILMSIALDRLLLTGDLTAIRAAGVRCREQATADALRAIKPGPRTLIDHRDIAGKNKPYCWRPWSADTVGFPRQRYIDEISRVDTFTKAELDAAVAAAEAPLREAIADLNAKVAALEAKIARAREELA